MATKKKTEVIDEGTLEVPIKLIRQYYKQACGEWQLKLTKDFPQLFASEWRIGDKFTAGTDTTIYQLVDSGDECVAIVDTVTGIINNNSNAKICLDAFPILTKEDVQNIKRHSNIKGDWTKIQ